MSFDRAAMANMPACLLLFYSSATLLLLFGLLPTTNLVHAEEEEEEQQLYSSLSLLDPFIIPPATATAATTTTTTVVVDEEECPLWNCCEEDCCGPGTRWQKGHSTCVIDPSSSGFDGSYSEDWEPGCVYRVCCGAMCCSSSSSSSNSDMMMMYYNDTQGFCLPKLPLPVCTKEEFGQIGKPIIGEASSDQSGRSISLSADGDILAIGSTFGAGIYGLKVGHVRVFKQNNNNWDQLGDTILGTPEVDPRTHPPDFEHGPEHGFGGSVSLSSDGTILAIGMPEFGGQQKYGGNGIFRGKVEIFKWTGKAWKQLGDAIKGEHQYDSCGLEVSLSSDGTLVAISSPDHGEGRGHVRIFQWKGDRWAQLGRDIDGDVEGESSGSVSLVSHNDQRHIVAIGSPFFQQDSSPKRDYAGRTRVFEWNSEANNNSSWKQVGSDIIGDQVQEQLGGSVSLSKDGQTVAIKASFHKIGVRSFSHVQVFRFNGTDWEQMGDNIYGDNFDRVALSGDGTVVATGDRNYDTRETAQQIGRLVVFQWNGKSWEQLKNSMYGEEQLDNLGASVALSEDGSIVAGGSPLHDRVKGSVRVFSCK